MWVKCEVEDLPCWAIVDTGASTSLISRHMASLVGKPVKVIVKLRLKFVFRQVSQNKRIGNQNKFLDPSEEFRTKLAT